MHVDAYRLGSLDELEALDLDASLDESVTVVEWGEGLVEGLAEDRLEIAIERPHGAGRASDGVGPTGLPADGSDDQPDDDGSSGTRTVAVRGVGPRWAGIVLPVVG